MVSSPQATTTETTMEEPVAAAWNKHTMVEGLPAWLRKPVLSLLTALRKARYGGTGRLCPVCGTGSSRFRVCGDPRHRNLQCVHCGSLARMRALWLFLQRRTDLFDGRATKLLHVAPEACFRDRLAEALGDGYLSADLKNPAALVEMDVTAIPRPEGHFDAILCSHVLEHVADDRKAMKEFFRVLAPGGWAVLLVPITGDVTFEDPSIVSPAARKRAFGQFDHVRAYGLDFAERLRHAGFAVEIFTVGNLFAEDEVERMGLRSADDKLFFCQKPL